MPHSVRSPFADGKNPPQAWCHLDPEGARRLAHNLRFLSLSRKFRALLIAILIISQALGAAIASAQEARNILFISFYDPDQPDIAAIIQAARSRIRAEWPGPERFQVEYVDSDAVAANPSLAANFAQEMHRKDSSQDFDLVVTIGPAPFEFARQYQSMLFPKAKLLFLVANPPDPEKWTTPAAGQTGVILKLDYLPTLRLLLQQNPNARHLIVIAGSSEFEQLELATARDQFHDAAPKGLDIQYVTNISVPDLEARINSAEPDSVVLFIDYVQDLRGDHIDSSRVLSTISAAAHCPIYGMYASDVGYGAVGGSVIDVANIGDVLGAEGGRILNGKEPEAIPVVSGEFQHYTFDWRQLKRWHIPLNRLPAGSAVLFREYSFWQQYYWEILIALAVLLAQAISIFVLLRHAERLRRAETNLANQLEFEGLTARVASRFIDISPRETLAEIEHVLEVLLERLKLDRVSLYEAAGPNEVHLVCTRSSNDAPPELLRVGGNEIFWIARKIEQGSVVAIDNLAMLPAEADATREHLQGMGVRSAIFLPVSDRPNSIGALACLSMTREVHWPPELVRHLQTIAAVFAGALRRARTLETLEATEEKLNLYFKQTLMGTIEWNSDFCVVAWNPACEAIFGYCEEEVKGQHADILLPAEVASDVKKLFFEQLFEQCEGYFFATENARKDGRKIVCEWLNTPIIGNDGRVTSVISLVQDITERKNLDDALRASEERFAKAFRQSPVVVMIVKEQTGEVLEVNETFESVIGYKRTEVIGSRTVDFDLWEDPARRYEFLAALQSGEVVRDLECRFRTKDGAMLDSLLSSDLMQINGEPCIISTIVDITQRKHLDDALRASEEKFSKAFRQNPVMVVITTSATDQIAEVNETFERVTGFARAEAIGRRARDLGLWEDPSRRDEIIEVAELAGSVQNMEVQLRAKDGRILDTLMSGEQIDIDGEPCIITSFMDITERMRLEAAVRASEEKFSKAFRESPVIIVITKSGNSEIVEVNEAFENATGFTRAEVTGKSAVELALWADLDRREAITEKIESGMWVRNEECRFRTKGGSMIDALMSAEFIEVDGELCVLSTLVDITERKRLVEALRESADKFSKAFEKNPEIMFLSTVDENRYLDVNDAFVAVSGYSKDEIIGRTSLELGFWDDSREYYKILEIFKAGRSIHGREFRFRARSGELFEALGSAEPIEIGGKPCFLAVIIDITARKRAERLLKESEQRFRSMADDAPMLIWLSDANHLRTDFNRAWLEFIGRTLNQELGDGWKDSIHPDDRAAYEEITSIATRECRGYNHDYRLRRYDGQYRWVLSHAAPRILADGSLAGFIGCSVDITELKKAEAVISEFGVRLINAQESERKRIARELHDDINQRLALLANGLHQLQSAESKENGFENSDRIRDLGRLTQDISSDIQHLSHQLHSTKLQYLGIGGAVRDLCHEFAKRHQIEVHCNVNQLPADLDPNVMLCLFRIVQESLRNVDSHSQATRVDVELFAESSLIQLCISDNGVGFDPSDPLHYTGLGLISMRERLRAVNGEFFISSWPARGTLIKCTVPATGQLDLSEMLKET